MNNGPVGPVSIRPSRGCGALGSIVGPRPLLGPTPTSRCRWPTHIQFTEISFSAAFNATVCLFVPLRHHLIGASWRSWPAWASFSFLSSSCFLLVIARSHIPPSCTVASPPTSLCTFSTVTVGAATSPRAGGGVVCSQPTRGHFTS